MLPAGKGNGGGGKAFVGWSTLVNYGISCLPLCAACARTRSCSYRIRGNTAKTSCCVQSTCCEDSVGIELNQNLLYSSTPAILKCESPLHLRNVKFRLIVIKAKLEFCFLVTVPNPNPNPNNLNLRLPIFYPFLFVLQPAYPVSALRSKTWGEITCLVFVRKVGHEMKRIFLLASVIFSIIEERFLPGEAIVHRSDHLAVANG